MQVMKFRKEYLTRQSDLIPEQVLGQKITVIGAGAVGSHTIMSLARMGFGNICVWDFDEVSEENMNCQGYYMSDIGLNKAEAIKRHVQGAVGFTIQAVKEPWKGETPLEGIVILALDSMEVRKQAYTYMKKFGTAQMMIDPRMGAEFALMYVINPNDKKDQTTYEKTLYTDDDAVREPCTAKSTIYCANLLAGQVVKAVKDIVTGGDYIRNLEWNIRDNAMEAYRKSFDPTKGY